MDVFSLSIIFRLPLGAFLGLRGRLGLPCNHRGKQTKPGPWKTILSCLPHLLWDAEALLGRVLLTPPSSRTIPVPIRLGSEWEGGDLLSQAITLMVWDGEWPGRSKRPGHHQVRPRKPCFPHWPGWQPLTISKGWINSVAALSPPHTEPQHRPPGQQQNQG